MNPGDILTHAEMCTAEGIGMLQRGMTFRAPPNNGIILMSLRENAPYADALEADGSIVYEGHDWPRSPLIPEPKQVDQPRVTTRGGLTENGKFADWTDRYRARKALPARFHIYEKVRKGVWSFRGPYLLVDYRFEPSGERHVYKFVLRPASEASDPAAWADVPPSEQAAERRIPSWVMVEVFKRDRGQCVRCGATSNLHFDHIIPFSKGGSSLTPENIQVLCGRCNLAKGDEVG